MEENKKEFIIRILSEQHKNLIDKIKEVLPKKAGYCALNENTSPEEAYQIARNDFISSLPQVVNLIGEEIIDFCKEEGIEETGKALLKRLVN